MKTIPVTALPAMPAAGCNCAVCDFYIDNPAATQPVCSGTNTDCSYCGCARSRDCGECSIRCGSRVDIAAWMHDIGGTVEFDDIDAGPPVPERLPRFIPQVDTANVDDLDVGLGWSAYAIGLRRVFSMTTGELKPSFAGRTAAEAMGLGDRLSVLVGYGEDPVVEAMWTNRARVIEQLAVGEWDLVLAPNFSMYGNQPRAEHLINFRRNLLIAAELVDAGVPAVPNLYWFRLEDLQRYERWFDDVSPPAVAVNLQTFRTDADWDAMAIPGLSFLAAVMPSSTSMIVTGTSRQARIAQLSALFGDRLVLVSQNPVQYARHGAVMTAEGRRDVHAVVSDAFAANVRFYADVLNTNTPAPQRKDQQ